MNEIINRFPKSVEAAADPNVLLLHFNGDTLDSGGAGDAPHTMTDNGTATDTTNKVFGSASRLFTRASNHDITAPDSADWDVADGANRTIDMHIRAASAPASAMFLLMQREDASNYWFFLHNETNGIRFLVQSGGAPIIDITDSGNPIDDGAFYHIAYIRVGSDHGLYVDGAQVAYLSDASTDTFGGTLHIGNDDGPTQGWDGNIDELRIIPDNPFGALPVVGLTDTITVPVAEY